MIGTAAPLGLHEFVGERAFARYARPGMHAADLGTGPGAMAARLLDGPALARRLGQLAHQRVLDSCDNRRMIEAHVRAHRSILCAPGP